MTRQLNTHIFKDLLPTRDIKLILPRRVAFQIINLTQHLEVVAEVANQYIK